MSKLLSWLAATTIGAAIVTVTPALAFQGGGFGGGMGGMRMSRQVFVGGAPRFVGAPFAGRHFVDGAFFYYVPYCSKSGHHPAGSGLTPALATMATSVLILKFSA